MSDNANRPTGAIISELRQQADETGNTRLSEALSLVIDELARLPDSAARVTIARYTAAMNASPRPDDRVAGEAQRDLENALAQGRVWGKMLDGLFAPPRPQEKE